MSSLYVAQEIDSRFEILVLGSMRHSSFEKQTGRLSLAFTSGVSLEVTRSEDTHVEPDDVEWLFFVPGELAWRKTLTSLELGHIHATR